MSAQTQSSTHPILPPTTEDDRVNWLRLLRSRRVGIATFYRLLAEHGNATDALAALPQLAINAGLSKYTACTFEQAQREMHAGAQIGAKLICRGDTLYPELLSHISDAPPMLWMRGNPSALSRPMIALVGARNASSLGTRMARALATELAEAGYVIVSGLARGIDTCAHHAAAKHGSLAVLAGGVDVIYPAENAHLAMDLLENGALVSEQPFGMAPIARHFPMRNRIISGLCSASIVVEAAGKSGSLITARGALDQGRDVLAVPGHPFDARAAGCNMLIRDGATLVRNAKDVISVLEEIRAPSDTDSTYDDTAAQNETRTRDQTQMPLPLAPEKRAPRSLKEMSGLHQQILNRLGPSPIAEDQLLRDIDERVSSVIPALTDLEMRGQIKRAPGGLISRI